MSITVNSRIVAEASVQTVALQPLIGAYDLQFLLDIQVNADTKLQHEVYIHGARAFVRSGAGSQGRLELGHAWPVKPIQFQQGEYPTRTTPALSMKLSSGRLHALESVRDGGVLQFEIDVYGLAEEGQFVEENLRYRCEQSEWISQLNKAGARNIILLEVPLTKIGENSNGTDIAQHLEEAAKHLDAGHWKACVGACRVVVEEIWSRHFDGSDGRGEVLKMLANERKEMTKHQREAAILAGLYHYASLAHHSNSTGGSPEYSRADARMALLLTGQFVAWTGSN